ncbi:hypothetical protein [Paracoccus chinensis]|uniref:hypothetical protein n=1 Tax=Paracoccus chinensis TaxID=525640 RepID=UPI0015880D67|nr:hypothetical protein [Paracoccus chinensis]
MSGPPTALPVLPQLRQDEPLGLSRAGRDRGHGHLHLHGLAGARGWLDRSGNLKPGIAP